MRSFRVSNKTHICIFSTFRKNEYIQYIIKKVNKENLIDEYCVAFVKNSKNIFSNKVSEYIKLFKSDNESLSFFEKIELNDDEFCHVSFYGYVLCPECTNKTERFNCLNCSYHNFIVNKCTNRTYVDNLYKFPYIKGKGSGIILFKIGENSEIKSYINLYFENKNTILQLINQLNDISEFIKD